MPFDPDKYLAEKTQGFNPDAYLAGKGVDSKLPDGLEPSDTVDSSIRGFLSQLTAGHMPQIAGAVEHPVGAIKSLAGLTGTNVSNDPDVAAYTGTRDQYKNLYNQAWNDHPVAYGAGAIPGAIASPVNKLGPAAAAAVYGEGSSDADLTKGQVGQDLGDAAKGGIGGAILGRVLNPIANKASEVADYIGGKLGGLAENAAIRHLRPTPAVARNLGPEGLSGVAREALDSGAIQPFAKAGDTAAWLGDLADEVGAVKGDIVTNSAATIDPNRVANRVSDEVINPLRSTAEGQPLADKIQGKVDAFSQQYPGNTMTPAQLEAEKMAAQGNINYKVDPNSSVQANQDYARILKEEVEGAVKEPEFLSSKQSYGNLRQGADMAERTAGLTDGGLMSHITDVGLGAGALSHGNPIVGAVGLAGRAATKGRVASTVAVTLDKMSKAAPELYRAYAPAIQAAAAKGSVPLSTTLAVLQTKHPEFNRDQEDKP